MANTNSKAYKDFVAAGSPGGEGNFDAWLQNASKAGVYNPDGSPRQGMAGAASREMEGVGHSGYNAATGGYGAINSDTTGMRAYAREHGMSEDYDRFDEATLNLWEQHRDPNCPPAYPYQAMDGSGCAEKPIDTGLNAPQGPGKKGGAGASGKGGGGKVDANGNPIDDSYLQNQLVDLMQHQGGAFGEGGLGPGGQSVRLNQGGVWWAPPKAQSAPTAPVPKPGQKPGGAYGSNAFKQEWGAGGSGWDQFTPTAQNMMPVAGAALGTAMGTAHAAPAPGATPQLPAYKQGVLNDTLMNKYGQNPPEWWKL